MLRACHSHAAIAGPLSVGRTSSVPSQKDALHAKSCMLLSKQGSGEMQTLSTLVLWSWLAAQGKPTLFTARRATSVLRHKGPMPSIAQGRAKTRLEAGPMLAGIAIRACIARNRLSASEKNSNTAQLIACILPKERGSQRLAQEKHAASSLRRYQECLQKVIASVAESAHTTSRWCARIQSAAASFA